MYGAGRCGAVRFFRTASHSKMYPGSKSKRRTAPQGMTTEMQNPNRNTLYHSKVQDPRRTAPFISHKKNTMNIAFFLTVWCAAAARFFFLPFFPEPHHTTRV